MATPTPSINRYDGTPYHTITFVVGMLADGRDWTTEIVIECAPSYEAAVAEARELLTADGYRVGRLVR